MNARTELFKKYKGNRRRFVETGTYLGEGIQAAIDAGFSEACIVSFDVNEKKAAKARAKFLRAHLFCKSTPCLEFQGMATSRVPALFWLDAHRMSSGGKIGIDYPLFIESITDTARNTVRRRSFVRQVRHQRGNDCRDHEQNAKI